MDDKRTAVYSTIINFPTMEEARANAGEIAKSVLLGKSQIGAMITTMNTIASVREDLKAAGFTDKQIPRGSAQRQEERQRKNKR